MTICISRMVQNCGCINMAELAKKIHIRKGSTEQTVKLYTTVAEAGDAFAYIKVDGVQAYIPLGAENDSRATMGRVKEHTGSQFAILTSGKPPYHIDSYTNAGTYTWTCPAGVTKAKVTVAGGGGGGLELTGRNTVIHKGGRGALVTQTIDVNPHTTYTVVVGGGGAGQAKKYTVGPYTDCTAGGTSSFATLSARGGDPAYTNEKYPERDISGASYGEGALGGFWDAYDRKDYWWAAQGSIGKDGLTGWVNVEYGGDI